MLNVNNSLQSCANYTTVRESLSLLLASGISQMRFVLIRQYFVTILHLESKLMSRKGSSCYLSIWFGHLHIYQTNKERQKIQTEKEKEIIQNTKQKWRSIGISVIIWFLACRTRKICRELDISRKGEWEKTKNCR